MIRHYEGKLGVFDYDDTEWEITETGSNPYTHGRCKESLRYIGDKVEGEDIIIPFGVSDCSYMFMGCTSLTTAPEIPEAYTY